MYKYTENSREISGFGGNYERECKDMVIAGMKWFDENPSANPKFHEYKEITVIINPDNPDAESLEKAILKVSPDCTGAMMQACIGHCLFAAKEGWDKYIEKMEQLKV